MTRELKTQTNNQRIKHKLITKEKNTQTNKQKNMFNSLVINLCVYFSGYEFVCLILRLLVCVLISLVMSLCVYFSGY
jgi:hypothetical protein